MLKANNPWSSIIGLGLFAGIALLTLLSHLTMRSRLRVVIDTGILVPDLCLEETEVMQAATKSAGLELTQLVTPTTPQERMKRIAAVSEGFVYLVSVTGRPEFEA